MRVEPTKQATFQESTRGFMDNRGSGQENDRPPSRALVAATPAPPAEISPRPRHATFLAHLIATKEQAPQTRERRRAQPQEAIAAYRAVAAITR